MLRTILIVLILSACNGDDLFDDFDYEVREIIGGNYDTQDVSPQCAKVTIDVDRLTDYPNNPCLQD